MTQRELAARAGTSQSAIARYERGDMSPSFETFSKVLNACGLELDGMLRKGRVDGEDVGAGGDARYLKSMLDLASVDQRVLRFTPLGLATSHVLRPDAALEYQQRVISSVVLPSDVPASVTANFERLRQLYLYGCFQYEFFTVAFDLSPLVLESALAERFVAYYNGSVPMVDAVGNTHHLAGATFDGIFNQLTSPPFRSRSKWSLMSKRAGDRMPFSGNLTDLLGWARFEGLLRGQRNRQADQLLVQMRNQAAHPSGYHLVSPVDAIRRIRDVAEIISRLWGHDTAGGRLYPAPVARQVLAIGWDLKAEHMRLFLRHHLADERDRREWQFLIVRAVYDDPSLWQYDREFESTNYPVDYLWGPGDLDHARTFVQGAREADDAVDILDRLFVVGVAAQSIDPPRRPQVFLGVEPAASKTWHLVRADYPVDAYVHVRHQTQKSVEIVGSCHECGAETVAIGVWDEIAERVRSLGITTPEYPDSIRVPSRMPRWPQ
jgi:transcriptional regulator with XRE-family HTH domain